MAFSSRALDTTQMSVQRPTSSMERSSAGAISFGSFTLPKVGFSTRALSASASAISGGIFQPSVPLMQWGTGSFLPSAVSR